VTAPKCVRSASHVPGRTMSTATGTSACRNAVSNGREIVRYPTSVGPPGRAVTTRMFSVALSPGKSNFEGCLSTRRVTGNRTASGESTSGSRSASQCNR
jgi:hypothetical protein